ALYQIVLESFKKRGSKKGSTAGTCVHCFWHVYEIMATFEATQKSPPLMGMARGGGMAILADDLCSWDDGKGRWHGSKAPEHLSFPPHLPSPSISPLPAPATMFWQIMADDLRSWDDGIAVFASDPAHAKTVSIISAQSKAIAAATRSLG
ncbi:unnamed protein product, partial [Closterium sp. Naga37s-1]